MTSRMLSSPTGSRSSDGLPFHSTSPSTSDFLIERVPKQYPTVSRVAPRPDEANYDEEYAFHESVSKLLHAKARPFVVAGRIPFDPSKLVLFFRSKARHLSFIPCSDSYISPHRVASRILSISPLTSNTTRLPPSTFSSQLANHTRLPIGTISQIANRSSTPRTSP